MAALTQATNAAVPIRHRRLTSPKVLARSLAAQPPGWDGADVSQSVVGLEPGVVAAEVLDLLVGGFSDRLLSVVAFGSWLHGDFEPARSDVDLLAVLAEDPTQEDVDALGARVEALFRAHPEWRDRIEVGLVSREAVREVVGTGTSTRLVGRISPGEPLHLVPAERRRVLDWEAAARGRTLHGEDGLLPPVPWPLVRQVLLAELVAWPGWLDELVGDEALAYAVLTVCRSTAYAVTETPHSKRAGARWTAGRRPELAPLCAAAEAVWYRAQRAEPLDRTAVGDLVRYLARWAGDDLRAG